ncbi:MAG: tetratricopeptide repeat protein [Candidatus Obscuribacterales bacterium]|nr:tetratricopeptide repeat protein [Candidatus Obscuribacterales bacterium]
MALFLCFFWTAQTPSLAFSQQLKEALYLYEAGNYRLAYVKFREAAVIDPYNPRLRYYLGNCLIKLGCLDDAVASFRACLSLNPDLEVSSKAWNALEQIHSARQSKNFRELQPAVNLAKPVPDFMSTEPPPALSRELKEALERLRLSRTARINDINATYLGQRSIVEKNLVKDIAQVPSYIYFGGKRIPNPDREIIVAELKAQSEARLQKISEENAKDLAREKLYFDGEETKLKESGENLRRQYASKGGENKAVSLGSGLFVRNYVNFGGAFEESMPSSVGTAAPPLPLELSAKTGRLQMKNKLDSELSAKTGRLPNKNKVEASKGAKQH